MRSCEACGKPMPVGAHRLKRFCDDRCRNRARKRGGAVAAVAELPLAAIGGSVELATREALTAADRLDTPVGQAALVLAVRLDHATADSGSAVAAMTRELRATMAEALAGAEQQADGIDEIKAQAEKRRQRAASGAR